MNRALIAVGVLLGTLASASPAGVVDTNEAEVRQNLTDQHEKVIHLKRFNEIEYAKFAAALAGGPPAVGKYLGGLVNEIATNAGKEIALDVISDLLMGKKPSFPTDKGEMYLKVVTYNRSLDATVPVVVFEGIRTRIEQRKVWCPLPNHHELVLAFGAKQQANNPRGNPPQPPAKAKPLTEDEAKEAVRDRFGFYLGRTPGAPEAQPYVDLGKKYGREAIEDAIAWFHGMQNVEASYVTFLGSQPSVEEKRKYLAVWKESGLIELNKAICRDYSVSVTKVTFGYYVGRDPGEATEVYRDQLLKESFTAMRDRIVKTHQNEVVVASYNDIIGKDPSDGDYQKYSEVWKQKGLIALNNEISRDNPELVVARRFRHFVGRKPSEGELATLQAYMLSTSLGSLQNQIVTTYGEKTAKEVFEDRIGRAPSRDELLYHTLKLRDLGFVKFKEFVDDEKAAGIK